ncbi:hypothetical protein BESB_021080 [Besnoitia besnoiti]|uniref:Uncharacterized protein n=1 Tax=Besnoitia besnoiti TaxID=94643 RepID=A0A2A9M970_BESBE|nr:hypothetical protein BESB_021080 [Besnoitia besnoiti]PFH32167.1 hypothetical protein BESB_021080 [Besnoitia besnoiti]
MMKPRVKARASRGLTSLAEPPRSRCSRCAAVRQLWLQRASAFVSSQAPESRSSSVASSRCFFWPLDPPFASLPASAASPTPPPCLHKRQRSAFTLFASSRLFSSSTPADDVPGLTETESASAAASDYPSDSPSPSVFSSSSLASHASHPEASGWRFSSSVSAASSPASFSPLRRRPRRADPRAESCEGLRGSRADDGSAGERRQDAESPSALSDGESASLLRLHPARRQRAFAANLLAEGAEASSVFSADSPQASRVAGASPSFQSRHAQAAPRSPLAAAARVATAAVRRRHHEAAFWRALGDEATRALLRLQEESVGDACAGAAARGGEENVQYDDVRLALVTEGSSLATLGRDLSELVNRFKQIRFTHARFLQTAEQTALLYIHRLSLHDAALLAASFASLNCNNVSFFFSLAEHVYQVSTAPSTPVATAAQTALQALQSSSASSPLTAPGASAAARRDAFLGALPPATSFALSLLLAATAEAQPVGAAPPATSWAARSVAEEVELFLALSWVHLVRAFARAHVPHSSLFEVAALPLCALLERQRAALARMQRAVLDRRARQRAKQAAAAGARGPLPLVALRPRHDEEASPGGDDVEALHGGLMRPSASACPRERATAALMPGRIVVRVLEAYAMFRFKHERLLRASVDTLSFLSFSDSDIESLRRSMAALEFEAPDFERLAALRLGAARP